METIKTQQEKAPSRVLQSRTSGNALQMEDNRQNSVWQAKMKETIQCLPEDDEDEQALQGKFEDDEEDSVMQGKFENNTGMPDHVKQGMENAFGSDFSSVHIHPESSKAPEVGALAYTQGTDIHFAPGQFKPDTTAGQQLLGHELTHVIQQAEGRVEPTTEVGGMAVNDNEGLEHEADVMGNRASSML